MLVEFRVENHRSIRREQALTMEAARSARRGDPRVRRVRRLRLLPAAGIYGANASGKSNVLDAFRFLREAVLDSFLGWPPEDRLPRDPFAWGADRRAPTLVEVVVVVDGVRYRYGFVADDRRFLEEWLDAWPNGHRQRWFVREGERLRTGPGLGGPRAFLENFLRPNALVLSTAVQAGYERLRPLYRWFRTSRHIPGPHVAPETGSWERMAGAGWDPRQATLFDEPRRRRILGRLLRAADLGIVDVSVRTERPDTGLAFLGQPRPRVFLRHRGPGREAWLPLEEESAGTRRLFQLAPDLLDVLERGSLLLVDDLDAGLHPGLTRRVVEQFNDPVTNPRGAQLLFTTHDTHLLAGLDGPAPLRHDQVWLVEKGDDGATDLFPLSDLPVEEVEDAELPYLAGRFGGVPSAGVLVSGWEE